MKAVVLDPATPFREIPRSDTLFGAICWGLRDSRGEAELEDFLASFADGDPPFTISSAVPVVEHERRHYLLPKPRLPGPRLDTDDEHESGGAQRLSETRLEALQTWKRLEYLPDTVFGRLARGDWTKADVLDRLEADQFTVGDHTYERCDEFLLPVKDEASADSDSDPAAADTSADAPPRPYEREPRTRSAINRLTSSTDGRLFQTERVQFHDRTQLAILARGETEAVVEGLALIQDRGIGGGRSIGNGQYRIEEDVIPNLPNPDADRVCTLSLCIPRAGELEAFTSEGYYEVETRKGVLETERAAHGGVWKRRVLALAEGSILPASDGPYAHNPVVADHFEHGVQQYGYAFPVGLRVAV